MSKNILIYSDGTGQFGGLKPDQRLSNIYKMYRASRISPDNPINPTEQVAFYDPGLGTGEKDSTLFTNPIDTITRLFSSMLGTGINKNIIDCYEAILKYYEPGDRIYLFGFSRGAYTVRCVANVMNLCGVPTQDCHGNSLPHYGKALRVIATEAVKKVYEHGVSKERGEYEDEREEQARRFRKKYNCEGKGRDGEPQGNVQPYFIGVFDTVAALGRSYILIALGIVAISVALAGLGCYFGFGFLDSWMLSSFFITFMVMLYIVKSGYRSINDFPKKGDRTRRHIISWKLTHYDKYLDNMVGYARHAISIDESRKNFPHVPWGRKEDAIRMKDQRPAWIKQVWFTGNHSDIGGSYPENESRLSDISLKWMLEEIKEVPEPVIFNDSLLNIYPASDGMQHCEIQALKDKWYPDWFPKKIQLSWPIKYRDPKGKMLHSSVIERLEHDCVNQYGDMKPYRPEALKEDKRVKKYFR